MVGLPLDLREHNKDSLDYPLGKRDSDVVVSRYDLVAYGPGSVHKDILTLARSYGVSIITAHVVQGASYPL